MILTGQTSQILKRDEESKIGSLSANSEKRQERTRREQSGILETRNMLATAIEFLLPMTSVPTQNPQVFLGAVWTLVPLQAEAERLRVDTAAVGEERTAQATALQQRHTGLHRPTIRNGRSNPTARAVEEMRCTMTIHTCITQAQSNRLGWSYARQQRYLQSFMFHD